MSMDKEKSGQKVDIYSWSFQVTQSIVSEGCCVSVMVYSPKMKHFLS